MPSVLISMTCLIQRPKADGRVISFVDESVVDCIGNRVLHRDEDGAWYLGSGKSSFEVRVSSKQQPLLSSP